jgi:ribonuclease P protein component
MLRNSLGRPRLGLAASKRVGIACARNRIKRRLREYFRLNRAKMPADMDMVFIALEGAATLDTHQLWTELDRFFARKF